MMSSSDLGLLRAALEIQSFFETRHWQFAMIGGLATMRWGELRTTIDVDGTLLTMFFLLLGIYAACMTIK